MLTKEIRANVSQKSLQNSGAAVEFCVCDEQNLRPRLDESSPTKNRKVFPLHLK